MTDGADIIPFAPKAAPEQATISADDREVIMQTLSNLMDLQNQHEQQMKLAINIIAELQAHVRDLEHDVARLKNDRAKKPVILNAEGARAN